MPDSEPVRIATRASELALRQARQVQALLTEAGIASELKTYKTLGDKRLMEPLSAIGAKGLFTKELEADLMKGKVDCCVHSLKDLPTTMSGDPTNGGPNGGLIIGALLPREDPRDVLLASAVIDATSIEDIPRGSRVGTSSLRRRAQLLALRPDLEVVDLRGNVPTRIRKVDEGQVHAAILAAAGLHRLDARSRITAYLDAPAWLPAAGQGAIAVQIRGDDERMRTLLAPLDDATTRVQTSAERAFLEALEGGCQVPIGALAVTDGSQPMLFGFISEVDGSRSVRGAHPLDLAEPELSGIRLANELRSGGASEILGHLRRAEQLARPQPE